MKFVIMEEYKSYIVEAEDIEEAVIKSYNNHCKYEAVYGVVRIPDNEEWEYMIQVEKHGNKYPHIRCVCRLCGCQFIFTHNDTYKVGYCNDIYEVINCPECSYPIDETQWDIWKEWICIFNFKKNKKKSHQPILNDYDLHLKLLLENEYHQANVKDLKSYTSRIYFKLKSLPIYPDGIEKEDAKRRIDSLKQCLQYTIEEYDDWLNEVNNYIDENKDKFEFYSGYRTGERNYPPMSYEIIDGAVRLLGLNV